MTTIDSEPRPGTAFKKIVEEQAMMDEFMAMIRKKMEADKRHLEGLIDLKKRWNPQWSDTVLWELMSPILRYFTEEINHLTAAQEDILTRLTSVQTRDEPVSLFYACEDKMEPVLRIGEALEQAYVDCEGCRQNMNTPEAQRAIAQARTAFNKIKQGPESYADFAMDDKLGILLPAEDRAYRIAVNKQHRTVSSVEEWYANGLDGIVERHQQRAEDIKAFLFGFCGSLGKLALDLSASCSNALHSNQASASTRLIAPRHEEVEREGNHLLLRKFEYRNFLNGRIVEPIFGLGPQRTLTLANQLLDAMDGSRPTFARYSSEVDWVFDLEEQILTNHALDITTVWPHWGDLYLLLKIILWSDAPLFPISSRYIDEYPNGVPRKKLRQIVDLIPPELRGSVMALLELMSIMLSNNSDYGPTPLVAVQVCHTQRAWRIIREILHKWDFQEDRPLPDGVKRDGPGELWTKTGRRYVPGNNSNQ